MPKSLKKSLRYLGNLFYTASLFPRIFCYSDKYLFCSLIKDIEIEISSLCNRSCDYCPQSSLHRPNTIMPLTMFENILTQLKEIQYMGGIAFHQFNEPLLVQEHLFSCIDVTKAILPNSKMYLFTNGDILDYELLLRFIQKKVSNIIVTTHLNKGEQFDIDICLSKVTKKAKILNIAHECCIVNEEKNFIRLEYTLENTKIQIQSYDLNVLGTDRMGTVAHLSSPKGHSHTCRMLFSTLNIAYSGEAYMCCDCCHDTKEALPYALGNIKEKSVLEVFARKREYMKKYLLGRKPRCCRTCSGY